MTLSANRRVAMYAGVAALAAIAGAGVAWRRHTADAMSSDALGTLWAAEFDTPNGESLPMKTPVLNLIPSSAIRLTLRCTTSSLSSFMLGIPYINSPPMRSSRSKTVTLWPAWLSWSAQASPAGPEPMMATFLPVLFLVDETWQSFFALTLTGQYIIKNVVLLSAAWFIFIFREGE